MLRYVIPSIAIPQTQVSSSWESHFEYLDMQYKSFDIQFTFSFNSHFISPLLYPPPDKIEGYFLISFFSFISYIFLQRQITCERLLMDIRRLSHYLLLFMILIYLFMIGSNKHPGNHFIIYIPAGNTIGFL